MGQEVDGEQYDAEAFAAFEQVLNDETAALEQWFADQRFSHRAWMAGFELEAWLTGPDAQPLAMNDAFLHMLGSSLVVPELSRFNVEINGSPTSLQGRAFHRLEDELNHTWEQCQDVGHELGAHLLMIGTLPTLAPEMLNLANMSALKRYKVLNNRLMSLRHGQPFELRIDGREQIRRTHPDLMLEAAATSFQVHLQVRQVDALRLYNASLAVSGPMVAVSANSPLLFGHDLWDETRIPLFEQAVAAGSEGWERVTFGHDYCRTSLFELFQDNRDHYPVLIPALRDEGPASLAHVRFHNGTIWRWNRPLIGFDHDGLPHLRIEHRVVPAGPTIIDSIANAALFYGMLATLSRRSTPIEEALDFDVARSNFYACARHGLDARIFWPGARGQVAAQTVLSDVLLPEARQGLIWLGIPSREVDHYLGVIEGRLCSGQTGARWQRRWAERHGRDLAELTLAYLERQQAGEPVHRWSLD